MEKFLIFTLAALSLFTIYNIHQSSFHKDQDNLEAQQAFEKFKVQYEKSYTNGEEQYRFYVFQKNKKLIDTHNNNVETTKAEYTLAINQFADLTWEEFQKSYLSEFTQVGTGKCTDQKTFFDKLSQEDLQDDSQVDWQKNGIVQAVKNQKMCGSCWAFSAVGAMESALAQKNGGSVPNLSEQELVDCSTPYGNNGCGGGLMNLGYDYVLDHHLNTEEKYPYSGRNQSCRTQQIGEGEASISSCVKLDASTDALTQALRKQPVAVAFFVNLTFQFYFRGIFNPWFCHGQPNHGVLAVGFDLTNKTPYYRIKNSWGQGWGEAGYFRMAIGKKKSGTCNITGHEFNYFPVA